MQWKDWKPFCVILVTFVVNFFWRRERRYRFWKRNPFRLHESQLNAGKAGTYSVCRSSRCSDWIPSDDNAHNATEKECVWWVSRYIVYFALKQQYTVKYNIQVTPISLTLDCFIPPENSNQKSCPSPQSNALILLLVSQTNGCSKPIFVFLRNSNLVAFTAPLYIMEDPHHKATSVHWK